MIISRMNLLSIKEVAEKLCISARRVSQLIDEKKLTAQRVGNQYIINEDDLKGVKIYGKAGRPPKAKESTKE
jgi:excisionase family DNA binding protein